MQKLRFGLIVAVVSFTCIATDRVEAEMVIFDFPIDVAQEVPAPDVSGLDPLPSGHGLATFHRDTKIVEWTIDYADLSGPIVPPGAHFHGPAARGVPAGVQIILSNGNPEKPATGQLVGSATLNEQQESDLLAGLWYVNIHTSRNSSGEIRGQIVPEPTGLAMVQLAGLFFLLWRPRRSTLGARDHHHFSRNSALWRRLRLPAGRGDLPQYAWFGQKFLAPGATGK